MGGFNSKPIVDKESSDGGNEKLKWGACSMQGWRLTQEDAHNCILDYDVNTSFFGVYDGHGGHEVAEYCSQNFPEFIKNSEEYRAGNIEAALTEGYLQFDSTLVKEEVIQQLKKIEEHKPAPETDSENEEEDISEMYEEATMPIEKVIAKYRNAIDGKREKRPTDDDRDCSGASSSGGCGSSNSESASDSGAGCSKATTSEPFNGISSSIEDDAEQSSEVSESTSNKNGEADSTENKTESPQKFESSNKKTEEIADSSTCVNGTVSTSDEKSSEAVQENGTVTKKGKGKALKKTKGVVTTTDSPKPITPINIDIELYNQFLHNKCDEVSDSSSEDDDDESFESPHEDSSDCDSEDTNNVTIDDDDDEESSDDDSDYTGESKLEGDNVECDVDDEIDEDNIIRTRSGKGFVKGMSKFRQMMKHGPGMDSGCTAVVAILKENDLYVANAGDSRCVLCKNGTAVPLSFDHKPYQDVECERIKKAGGFIDCDERVNGGLNLSRAIGDHAYKQNTDLSPSEQMITALPDVKKITIDPSEDEFLILACDGIWDCYSNQEVVDFIRPRLQEIGDSSKLSQICEELFDKCLSNNSYGAGCDNMTAIIVKFNSSSLKRPSSPLTEGVVEKKAKTDETISNVVDTTV